MRPVVVGFSVLFFLHRRGIKCGINSYSSSSCLSIVRILQSDWESHIGLLVLVYELPECKLTQGSILDCPLLTLEKDMLLLNELNAHSYCFFLSD